MNINKKSVIIIVAVIAFLVVAGLSCKKAIAPAQIPAGEANKPAEGQAAIPKQTEEQKMLEEAKKIDSDLDGLTNEEEIKAGSKSDSVDSDNDGLLDYDEVKVYNTNPNKADTDGDGYLDGDEVRRGYNPNGPGKLKM